MKRGGMTVSRIVSSSVFPIRSRLRVDARRLSAEAETTGQTRSAASSIKSMLQKGNQLLPHLVTFSPEAKSLWVEWFNAHAAEMEDPGFSDRHAGVYSKLRAHAPRFALILSRLRLACDPCPPQEPQPWTTADVSTLPPTIPVDVRGRSSWWNTSSRNQPDQSTDDRRDRQRGRQGAGRLDQTAWKAHVSRGGSPGGPASFPRPPRGFGRRNRRPQRRVGAIRPRHEPPTRQTRPQVEPGLRCPPRFDRSPRELPAIPLFQVPTPECLEFW